MAATKYNQYCFDASSEAELWGRALRPYLETAFVTVLIPASTDLFGLCKYKHIIKEEEMALSRFSSAFLHHELVLQKKSALLLQIDITVLQPAETNDKSSSTQEIKHGSPMQTMLLQDKNNSCCPSTMSHQLVEHYLMTVLSPLTSLHSYLHTITVSWKRINQKGNGISKLKMKTSS